MPRGLGEFSFAVVGVARNTATTIGADVRRIQVALAGAKTVSWFVVESDSADNTVSELEKLKTAIPQFDYESLGDLTEQFPRRTDRIAHSRNHYLSHLNNDKVLSEADYVIVADFDGVNSHISSTGIASCFEHTDWEVCAANQDGPYYDIWALRHPVWCPNDCWAEFHFLEKFRNDREKNLDTAIRSRMITIPQDADWLEVDSAFGGLAIYRREALNNAKYQGTAEMGDPVCEHVPFHQLLKAKGARIFINPRLVNTTVTPHSSAAAGLLPARRRPTWRKRLRTMRRILGLTTSR